MTYRIDRAAVLGAGVMGARIAAHLANAGIPTYLLDIVAPEGDRDRIVKAGFEAAKKSKPAAFFTADHAAYITPGNFEDNLGWVANADWIIEAVAEKLEIKRSLLSKVDKLRRPGSIVSTNTSGLPVNVIAEGLSEDFRRHWLGTHFFNPPRYLHMLEIIPGRDTQPDVLEAVTTFADRRLGKGIVLAKDTPNFIGNRIGTFSMQNLMKVMQEEGLTIEEVDALTGQASGMPKSGTFRLLDLVGLDTAINVVSNLYENVPGDPWREIFRVPPFMSEMAKRGWLGDKTGQGFYKKQKKGGGESEILALDLNTMEYRPRQKAKFASLEMAKNIDDPRERVRSTLTAEDKAGRFAWKTMSEVWIYAATRVPEISDRIVEIDRAMKWGFAWELGLFEMWDAYGVKASLKRFEKEGRQVPENVTRMLAAGADSFYTRHHGQTQYFDFCTDSYRDLEQAPGVIILADEKDRARTIKENAGASLIDLGDGVCCVEFHAKMNAIGPDLVGMLATGVEEAEKNFAAMIVANQGANFSVGANLMLALMTMQEEDWDEIDFAVRRFQQVNQAIKYSKRPVVVAPFGMALGGGCEIPLHAARIRAHAELYIGLVEVGVGLIPGAGGCKEMVVRANETAGEDGNIFDAVKEVFEQTAFAKVSTSAEEARRYKFLRKADSITMNRDRLVADAKAVALELANDGYAPPVPPQLRVPGETGLAMLKLGVHLAHEAQYISDYDAHVARKLAHVLCGGNLSGVQRVHEQYLLDLEREAFLSLCGEKKTQERIAHTLKTGKPLRN